MRFNSRKKAVFIDYAMSNTYTETMTETNIAVATHGITKIYGGIRRVDDVSMRVVKGEIYGLIGRNGAGKTTLIRMILGIASPSSGSVELCGAKTPEGLAEMRRRTGALIEQPAFYPRLSAAGNIKAYALAVGLGGIDPAPLLSLVGLGDVGKKQVRNFSLGMKQRLAIAMALAGDPELLFLDEPVNGLDPTGIFEVRELIRTLNAERGVTVVISSHLLGELGRVATAYGVMREGKLVAEVRGEELAALSRPRVRAVVADREQAEAVLAAHFDAGEYVMNGNTADIFAPAEKLAEIGTMFASAGVPLLQLSAERGDLESAFIGML